MEQGVVPISDAVEAIERGDDGLWLVRTAKTAYAAPHVVVASGARLRKLGVPGEDAFFGQGVSECADCDGPMFKDMETVVVGGGDSAFQEALALSQYASKVTLIMHGDGPRARADLLQRAAANPKIVPRVRTEVLAIEGRADKGVEAVRVRTGEGGEETLACAGVFVFIGLEPNTGFAPAEAERDPSGALVVSDDCATNLPGLWAIGAARSGNPGLLIDAAADAERAMTALAGALSPMARA
jgi:thioredoxin reductase (NADPH)